MSKYIEENIPSWLTVVVSHKILRPWEAHGDHFKAVTVASIVDIKSGEVVGIGIARCSRKDRLRLIRGREIAVGRAMKNMGASNLARMDRIQRAHRIYDVLDDINKLVEKIDKLVGRQAG